MNSAFWQDKRVFLTGHTGFKGAWLALWLQRLGAKVTGFALDPPTQPSLFSDAGIATGMTDLRGDVRELSRLLSAMQVARPHVVFHLAAQSLVRESYTVPVDTYATNVLGTVHLLEAARQVPGIEAVLVVTSDKCYENREWMWGYRENEPMGGRDPYSSSKGCAELVTAAYRDSFFVNGPQVATARAGNVIGGGDWAKDRLVPDAVKAFQQRLPLVVRNPQAVRPWQHVLEPLHGYLVLAEALCSREPEFASAWNFGPADQDAQSVAWVVDRLAAGWGEGARWEREVRPQPHEAVSLHLDWAKARHVLKWQPALRLPDALDWTMRWYQAYFRGQNARDLVERDIAAYEDLLRKRVESCTN